MRYNASIEQPMVRNAGKALGLSAQLNLTNPAKATRGGIWHLRRGDEGVKPSVAPRATPFDQPRFDRDDEVYGRLASLEGMGRRTKTRRGYGLRAVMGRGENRLTLEIRQIGGRMTCRLRPAALLDRP